MRFVFVGLQLIRNLKHQELYISQISQTRTQMALTKHPASGTGRNCSKKIYHFKIAPPQLSRNRFVMRMWLRKKGTER